MVASASQRRTIRTRGSISHAARGKVCDRDAVVRALESGTLAGTGAHSYTAGDATRGSEDAERFKKAG